MKARLFLVLANLFWAGNYIFGKYVVADMSPVWLTFLRWCLALLFLIPISYRTEKPDYKAVLKTYWLSLAVLGLLGIIGYNLLLYASLRYTSAVNASLVNALCPAMIVLFSLVLLKERVTWLQIGGFFLSLIGVVFVLTKGNVAYVFQTHYNRGDLLMFAADFVWTLYSVVGKRIDVPPITATTLSVAFSVVMLLPFVVAHPIRFAGVSALAWSGIIYIWLFPSVCSFVFWNIGVKKIGANQAGIYLNLLTLFTVIIGSLTGEKLLLSQIAGGVLIILGVVATTGSSKKAMRARESDKVAQSN
ncbi:transporter [Collibacillus ludicampi]|uniref:Transporter n=1 Tax=Collibacillus ludicampi TaxID=2771369 RepID=A0AAV4LJA3_9BACL|nr:DMT family transporter [Collibacillus ludicampi]GIM47957.1 transporter [Collibacillus ludicampi]